MRRAMLAGAAVVGLCGPAGAFDFAPDAFGDAYNAAAAARGWHERLVLRDCDEGCRYSFGTGTRVEVRGGAAGRASAVVFAFDWHARSLPGLRTAPMVMMDVLGVSPEDRRRIVHEVFNGDIVAYSRMPAAVTVGGVAYRATDPSPADEVTYRFEDAR